MMKKSTLFVLSLSLLNLTTLCMDPHNPKQMNTQTYMRRITAKKLTQKHSPQPKTQNLQRNKLNPTPTAVAPNPDKKK
jgi:hypothetical protein